MMNANNILLCNGIFRVIYSSETHDFIKILLELNDTQINDLNIGKTVLDCNLALDTLD